MLLTTLPRPASYMGQLAPENHALAGDFQDTTMLLSEIKIMESRDHTLVLSGLLAETCSGRSDLLIAFAVRCGYQQPEHQEVVLRKYKPEHGAYGAEANLALFAAVAWLREEGWTPEQLLGEAEDIQAALEDEAASEGPATELQIREAEAREEERWEEEADQFRRSERNHEDTCPCSDCKARLHYPFI